MSVSDQLSQLQLDLQNELTIANQLLHLISSELHKIKTLTRPGGEFESNIIQNASLIKNLSSIQKIDLQKVPQMKRTQNTDITQNTNQNLSYEQYDSFRSNMNQSS